jgi:hypothetical protein
MYCTGALQFARVPTLYTVHIPLPRYRDVGGGRQCCKKHLLHWAPPAPPIQLREGGPLEGVALKFMDIKLTTYTTEYRILIDFITKKDEGKFCSGSCALRVKVGVGASHTILCLISR